MRRVHDALAQQLAACIEQRLEGDSRLETEHERVVELIERHWEEVASLPVAPRASYEQLDERVREWALYEAAQSACKPQSPDYADYHQLKARGLSHTRATLTIARKLARRCFHSLRELGPAALEPAT